MKILRKFQRNKLTLDLNTEMNLMKLWDVNVRAVPFIYGVHGTGVTYNLS